MAEVAPDERLTHMWNKLWNDPNLGPQVQQMAKAEFPDVVTPADQFAPVLNPLMQQLEATNAKLKAYEDERAADALAKSERDKADYQAKFESDFNSSVKAYNLTDEGKQAVIDHMQKTKAFDPEAACALIASKMPAVVTPKVNNASHPIFDAIKRTQTPDENVKLLHESPEAFEDAVLNEFFADPDAFVQQTFAA